MTSAEYAHHFLVTVFRMLDAAILDFIRLDASNDRPKEMSQFSVSNQSGDGRVRQKKRKGVKIIVPNK